MTQSKIIYNLSLNLIADKQVHLSFVRIESIRIPQRKTSLLLKKQTNKKTKTHTPKIVYKIENKQKAWLQQ